MTYTIDDFTAKFPPVTMPVTLGEETHHVFGLENEPIPVEMIRQFIHPTEINPVEDEFTEYIPCFSIPNTEHFFAVVWWKAALLHYQYVLATFTPQGALISRNVIAETRVKEGKIIRSVATINEDWEIMIAVGESKDGNLSFDPTSTRTFDLEIMSNGEIVS